MYGINLELIKMVVFFEEISTTSYKDDSFYKDKRISKLSRDERKTYVKNWGFGAIDNKYGFSN